MIELRFVCDNLPSANSVTITDAPCVPLVGALIDLPYGRCTVQRHLYEYYPGGNAYVTVTVSSLLNQPRKKRTA